MTSSKWVAILLAGLVAASAEAASKKKQAKGLETALNAGLTLTDGNSETLQATASLVTEGEKESLGSVRAGVQAQYGESTVNETKDTTVDTAKIFANTKKTLSPRTFAYLDASALYDNVAEIDYRATLGPGLGAYLVKDANLSLSVEAGPSYVWEDVANVSDDYLALRAAERCEWQVSETAKLWQSAEYLADVDDFDNFIVTAELGAEAAVNDRVSLRLVLQDKYDNEPGAGLEENDLTLTGGVGIKL